MNNCPIAKDLIPLYIEGLTNEESSDFVKNHMKQCADCRAYYERIKHDYEQATPEPPDRKQVDDLIVKLAKYQNNIKLMGVLTAMFLSCVITGAGVQFLSTIPFLFIVPFYCRWVYSKSWPIIVSAIPFAIIGAALSEESTSYIPFFTGIALIATIIGTISGASMKHGMKQVKASWKNVYIIPAIAAITVGSFAYFSFFGNPVGYIDTMNKTKQYVNQTYEQGTLTFKGVKYNFKDQHHYGQFEYVLNGIRQTAEIGFHRDGSVNDMYKFVLALQFAEERSADLKTAIAAYIDYDPVTIIADPVEELAITRDELNSIYYHLSYDEERRNKATRLRESESSKLNYHISFGPFPDQVARMSPQQFSAKVDAIRTALDEREIPFRQIVIQAHDEEGNLQTSTLTSD